MDITQHPTSGVLAALERLPRRAVIAAALAALGVVGAVDYLTGYEVNCTVFYLLPVGIAAWRIGGGFGLVVSILSALSNSAADLLTGRRYSHHFGPFWNAAIVVTSYLVVVWLLRTLRRSNDTLDERVRQRTESLAAELVERKRLEKEILVIAEREQQRIGRDIHDSLCQHLTGTALAEQFLVEKLTARGIPEVEDADRVVTLIEDGIAMARGLAAGLSPIAMDGEGFLDALGDLAAHFSGQFGVACRFSYTEPPLLIGEPEVTTHLYRIVQEAVHNAIRHGRARNIAIGLRKTGPVATLTISDDGAGLAGEGQPGQGMGLRNMQYRASMIGGSLTLSTGHPGAVVTCRFQYPAQTVTRP